MNNKPKYSLFKNAKYALDGLTHALKSETSFKLELFFGFFIFIAIYSLPLTFYSKMILVITAFLILIVELLNSAIENVVDLVTNKIHPLAKAAKDVAATAVLFSLILHILCWILVIMYELF